MQRERGDRDRGDPQRQIQTRRAGGVQQRIANRAEDHARHDQRRNEGGWHGVEASHPRECLADDAAVGIPTGTAVAAPFAFNLSETSSPRHRHIPPLRPIVTLYNIKNSV